MLWMGLGLGALWLWTRPKTATIGALSLTVTQPMRIQFLNDHWSDLMAYAPKEPSNPEAFQAAVESYRNSLFQPNVEAGSINPAVVAIHAYDQDYEFFGGRLVGRRDEKVKKFFEQVLGRIDDMLLYQYMRANGYSEEKARRRIYWGRQGAPKGSEPNGFLTR